MDYTDTYRIVEELGKRLPCVFPDSDKRMIETLYQQVFDRPLKACNCKNRHADAVIEMRYHLKTHTTMNEKCNYKLKAGVVIHSSMSGTCEVYTNANLTDAVASAFLKERPKARNLFLVIPENTPVNETELREDLIEAIVSDLKAGMSQNKIVEKYQSTENDDERPTQAFIKAHVKAAKAKIGK